MTAYSHRPYGNDAIIRSIVTPRAAAHRDGKEAGVFYDDAYQPVEVGPDPALVAGTRDDPVLVCGVGNPLLSDLAVGPVLAYHVARLAIPGVAVADASHTPIATFQTLEAGEYDTVIVVGGEKRGEGAFADGTPSRDPGAIHEFGPDDYDVRADEELVKRVGESAMGSNTVEDVLVIADAFDALPVATRAVTVEVGYDSWGMNVDEFTDPVETALADVFDRVLDHLDAAVECEVRADRSGPPDPAPNEGIRDGDGSVNHEPPGTSGVPLEDERVNPAAIARMDPSVRETLTGLDDGTVAGTEL